MERDVKTARDRAFLLLTTTTRSRRSRAHQDSTSSTSRHHYSLCSGIRLLLWGPLGLRATEGQVASLRRLSGSRAGLRLGLLSTLAPPRPRAPASLARLRPSSRELPDLWSSRGVGSLGCTQQRLHSRFRGAHCLPRPVNRQDFRSKVDGDLLGDSGPDRGSGRRLSTRSRAPQRPETNRSRRVQLPSTTQVLDRCRGSRPSTHRLGWAWCESDNARLLLRGTRTEAMC